MRLWWRLLLVTERAFPIKQRLCSVLAKKTQHLFLTMAVPIKCLIKCIVENEKNCLCAWKIKQRKLNEMRTWICRQGIIPFVPMHPLCQCFPVIFSNHLASILQPYPLLYSEPWEKSFHLTRVFFKNSYEKKLYSCWKPTIFSWLQGTEGVQRLINLLKITSY